MMPAGHRDSHQTIAVEQIDGDEPGRAGAGEIGARGLLDDAERRRHQHEAVGVEVAPREDGTDTLARLERQDVDHRLAAGGTRGARQLVDPDPVDLAAVREEQHRVVGVRDEEPLDEVLFLRGRRGLAATPAALRRVAVERLPLHVAVVRHRHHHVLRLDEVQDVHALAVHLDLGAPGVGELRLHLQKLLAHHLAQPIRIDEDLQQPADTFQQRVELLDDLLLLQAGQAVQAEIEDRLGLHLAQPVSVFVQPESGGEVVGLRGVRAGPREQVPHGPGRPDAPRQALPGLGRVGRCPDERDDRFDVRERDRETFQNVSPHPRLAELEDGAPRHHLAPVAYERLDHLADVEQPGLTVDQGDQVDAEHRLQRGVLIQVVQHDLGVLAAAQLDDDAHAVLVGLVTQRGDAFDFLVFDQLGNLFHQPRLVHLIRQLADDDATACASAFDRSRYPRVLPGHKCARDRCGRPRGCPTCR